MDGVFIASVGVAASADVNYHGLLLFPNLFLILLLVAFLILTLEHRHEHISADKTKCNFIKILF